MPRLGLSICCGLPISLLVSSLPAQQAPAQPAPQLVPRTAAERQHTWDANHRVTLLVQVTDSSGKPVQGLSEHDFTVLDNQQPRSLLSFTAVRGATVPAPPHVILVLDEINDSSAGLAWARKGIQELLRSEAQLPWLTSIAVLSQAGLQIGGASNKTDALSHQLSLLAPTLDPENCRYDNSDDLRSAATALRGSVDFDRSTMSPDCLNSHFVQSIGQLRNFAAGQVQVPGRDLMIWLGPGWPLLTGPGFRPDSDENKQNFFDNLVQLSNSLRESQVTLDAISRRDAAPWLGLREAVLDKSVAQAADASATSLALQRLARQSGGQVIEEKAHLAGAIARCMADANAWYALSFNSPPATEVQLHSISVQIDRPGVSARADTGYYDEP